MSARRSRATWYRLTVSDIKKFLETDTATGLSADEAIKRRARYGTNSFESHKRPGLISKVLQQFKSPLVIILLISAIATALLKEYVDAGVIATALLINLVIGLLQESRADSAFEKLVTSQEKFATVIRNGDKIRIHAEELVPGDIIMLEAGSRIPADARIVSANNLTVNESPLTGEWEDVPKHDRTIKTDATLVEQKNMLWMGTLVTKGNAKAIVVETGLATHMGSIAHELSQTVEEMIPLQRNVQRLAAYLSVVIFIAIVLILIAGLAHGNDPVDMLLLAIAVAVAAMPEGLPAAVTVVLALGMENILKRGGLVRNLMAAETLGNTTVILTDKTGTITKAQMHIADIITERSLHHGSERRSFEKGLGEHDKEDVLSMALLTSEGYVEGEKDTLGEWVIHGGPIERAVILAGIESGIRQEDLLERTPRLDLAPFDSERRFVASLHRTGSESSKARRIYLAGAPEYLLEKAVFVYSDEKEKKMTDHVRSIIEEAQRAQSVKGMRVVAVGYANVSEVDAFPDDPTQIETDLLGSIVLAGLLVLHDPVRDDVAGSIETAHRAGATVIMLTGDNPTTALTIATEVGIAQEGARAYTGADIDTLDDDTLMEILREARVFARVLPHQKLRIARLLRAQGEIVAMTGDGINDAPTLRSADIGIALGSGTDVAKESADLVLLTNSFSVIVAAIEEGRRIQDNLKKIVAYLVSTSFTELVVIGASLIAGTPLPILATQILWINIVQEGFMNFAFAFEPAEEGVMDRKPSAHASEQILTDDLKKLIAIIALLTGVSLVALYFILLPIVDLSELRTIMFISLSAGTLLFAFSIKNLYRPVWRIDLRGNVYLIAAFAISMAALFAALEIPILREILHLKDLGGKEFLYVAAVGVFNLAAVEIAKYFAFERKK